MNKLCAVLLAVSLAGCATTEAPLSLIAKPAAHHHAVKPAAPATAPVVAPAPAAKPATFKQRWQEFRHKHPVKWFHH